MHRLGWVTALIVTVLVCADTGAESLERRTCGWSEGLAFRLWRHVAHRIDPGTEPLGVESYSVTTVDGRVLRGYKLPGAARARAAILVIQGNAMTAATVVDALRPLTTTGADVYILDFRGYGKSEGVPRLAALLSDYTHMVGRLRASGYRYIYVYGASLGGVIAANVLGGGADVDSVVIDSAPANVTHYGCPSALDPVAQLKATCKNVMVITGGSDPIIKATQMRALVDRVSLCGGEILTRPSWSHPFMDNAAITKARLTAASRFFAATQQQER